MKRDLGPRHFTFQMVSAGVKYSVHMEEKIGGTNVSAVVMTRLQAAEFVLRLKIHQDEVWDRPEVWAARYADRSICPGPYPPH